MTQKIVKWASIEILPLHKLHIGDYILWGRQKVIISKIDHQNRIVTAEEPIGELKSVSSYYRIINCYEERSKTICPGCGEIIESFTDYADDFCTPICKDKYDEAVLKDEIYY